MTVPSGARERTMKFRIVLLACGLAIIAPSSSFAISVELAKRCRAMAIKAYPPALAGSKTGDAQQERNYFNVCIAKNGRMDGDAPKATVAAPQKNK